MLGDLILQQSKLWVPEYRIAGITPAGSPRTSQMAAAAKLSTAAGRHRLGTMLSYLQTSCMADCILLSIQVLSHDPRGRAFSASSGHQPGSRALVAVLVLNGPLDIGLMVGVVTAKTGPLHFT